MSRVLALDYGSARCGCAISDPTNTIASPIDPVLRPSTKRGLAAISSLVEQLEVDEVVVGLPLSLSGSDTEQTKETREFASRLQRRLGSGTNVVMHDERFTTKLAAAQRSAKHSEDSRAAAHLLESWLTRREGSGDGRPS